MLNFFAIKMAYPQTTFWQTTVSVDSLVGRRREIVSATTLLHQLDILQDTGRFDAFKLKWHPVYDESPLVWPIPNHLFWDSDVAKWIEGACYFLQQQANRKVDEAINDLVMMIRGAQQPDGYLNIHYTVVEPGKRFTNLRDFHELYATGHNFDLLETDYRTVTMLDISLKLRLLTSSCTKMAPCFTPSLDTLIYSATHLALDTDRYTAIPGILRLN